MVQNRICTSQALKKWVSYLTTAPVEAQSSFTSVPVFSGMLGCPDSYGPDDYTNSISWKAAIHSDVPLHLGKLRWTENVQNNKRSFHKFLKVSRWKWPPRSWERDARRMPDSENRKVLQMDGRPVLGRTRLTARIESRAKTTPRSKHASSLKRKQAERGRCKWGLNRPHGEPRRATEESRARKKERTGQGTQQKIDGAGSSGKEKRGRRRTIEGTNR